MRKVINRSSAYAATQGVLGTLGLTFGALTAGASIDFFMLKSEADLSAFGAELYPALITAGLVGLGATVALMVWGYLVHNRFWLRIDLANNLRSLAEKVDPRRK